MSNGVEKRLEERYAADLPLTLDSGTGMTRNMSASGVFFETDEDVNPGSEIDFTIVLDAFMPGGPICLRCRGKVVRVTRMGGRVGVGVALDHREFVSHPSS